MTEPQPMPARTLREEVRHLLAESLDLLRSGDEWGIRPTPEVCWALLRGEVVAGAPRIPTERVMLVALADAVVRLSEDAATVNARIASLEMARRDLGHELERLRAENQQLRRSVAEIGDRTVGSILYGPAAFNLKQPPTEGGFGE